MGIASRVSGTWRDTFPKVKVSGTWRIVTEGWVKVSGTWRKFYPEEIYSLNTPQSLVSETIGSHSQWAYDGTLVNNFAAYPAPASIDVGGYRYFKGSVRETGESVIRYGISRILL